MNCSIEGCNKIHYAKGLCRFHYDRTRKGITDMQPGRLSLIWKENDIRYLRANKNKKCAVIECDEKVYAKDLCRKHWGLNNRNGFPGYKKDSKIIIKCKADNCNNQVINTSSHGYCSFHYTRYKRGTPFDRPKGIKGELNPRWNNGTSQYPNHSLFKKNRLIALERDGYKCVYCGVETNQVHHKDLSKSNHSLDNLDSCCSSCNLKMCNPRKIYTSKFRRKYGLSVKDASIKLNMCTTYIRILDKKGELYRMLNPIPENIQNILF